MISGIAVADAFYFAWCKLIFPSWPIVLPNSWLIMILGVAGKMGPTLAGLARAALPDRRIIGVARFSEPGSKEWLQARGIETINCDLLDEAAIGALPKIPNIIFMREVNALSTENGFSTPR